MAVVLRRDSARVFWLSSPATAEATIALARKEALHRVTRRGDDDGLPDSQDARWEWLVFSRGAAPNSRPQRQEGDRG